MAKRWYVIHTYSGYENKVKADLEHRIETYGLGDQIVDIQIPTEEVTEIKEGGKRETKESKVFPSYVLVRMEVTDDSWSVVRNTPETYTVYNVADWVYEDDSILAPEYTL